jgi:hypothetical protein
MDILQQEVDLVEEGGAARRARRPAAAVETEQMDMLSLVLGSVSITAYFS